MHRMVFLSLFVLACGPARIEVEMKEVSNSGQNGKALLIERPEENSEEARTEVQLDVSKGINGLYQFVGIYEGSCSEPKALLQRVGLAKDGTVSSQFVTESLDDLRKGHALVLRQDSRDDSPLASCGDIR